MSSTPTDAAFRVQQALRVKGAATLDDVRRVSGLEDPAPVLEELSAVDTVVARDAGTHRYFALSEEGRDRHAVAVSARLDAGARAELARVYDERFIPVNVTFKQLCADWQEEQRFELVEVAVDIHEEIEGVLRAAAEIDDRFARYAARLASSMDAFQDGDSDALVAPVGDSYHNIWFELHEDLLVTLERSRADEEA